MPKPRLTLTRPRDRSLEAYQEFVRSLSQEMNADAADMTEQEWKDAWEEFWRED